MRPPRAELLAQARTSIAAGSQSFAAASLLFDPATRERAHLLYAWCRRCDDIADGQDHGGALADDGSDPRERLAIIRQLTARALAGEATGDFAFDALGEVAAECGLTAAQCEAVIGGFALDTAGWQPRSESDLMRYCFHVAGAVGVLMARVMGVPPEAGATLDAACDLGLAFQLANIARDVREDAAAGRCYLPGEWLAGADIPPGEQLAPQHRAALVALVARMLDLAECHEASARVGARALAFRQRWAVLSAANIYGAIGRKVRAAGAQAWDRRVHTGRWEKARHVLAALAEAVTGPPPPRAALPQWRRSALARLAQGQAEACSESAPG